MLAPSTTSYAIPAKVSYPTDIDDTAWALIGPVLRRQTTRGRPRVHGDREVYDAITYVLRGGIAWRLLPKSFPPWQTIYGRFRTWADNGVWEKLTDVVRTILRAEMGRELSPSAGVIDSQSVTSGPGCGAVGNDPGKSAEALLQPGFTVASDTSLLTPKDSCSGSLSPQPTSKTPPQRQAFWMRLWLTRQGCDVFGVTLATKASSSTGRRQLTTSRWR